MTELKLKREYGIYCAWGARAATPGGLASRFFWTIDQLHNIDPLFDGWIWYNEEISYDSDGELGSALLTEIRGNLERAIAENIRRDVGTREPNSDLGYAMPIYRSEKSGGRTIHLSIYDGNSWSYKTYAKNHADLTIRGGSGTPPLVSFPTFKAAMLILAETWEATWAKAFPNDMVQKTDWDGMKPGWGWMVYVCPHLAKLVTPPSGVLVERRPNGGLFLAATDEVFDADNPRHIAAARLIRDAMRPVTSLEEPFAGPYL